MHVNPPSSKKHVILAQMQQREFSVASVLAEQGVAPHSKFPGLLLRLEPATHKNEPPSVPSVL